MSTVPLRIDTLEDGLRPRDWRPRRSNCKVPLRVLRLCVLGIFLPATLVIGSIYLQYRVYSEQLYPLAISDQRMIDARVSTTWCQSQVVKANATFNAYLMSDVPLVQSKAVPISMTRHLVLEDDMKEYWGFYLLRGSSVTVSTCVRWPGASLTIIRGHKHLHECAFIGDDSSEELEELLEIAQERGLLNINGTTEASTSLSNVPEKMRRAGQDVHFHHQDGAVGSLPPSHGSHELDDQAMRRVLTELFAKTHDMKRRKEHPPPHHRYKGVFRESANIDQPLAATASYPGMNYPSTWSPRQETKSTGGSSGDSETPTESGTKPTPAEPKNESLSSSSSEEETEKSSEGPSSSDEEKRRDREEFTRSRKDSASSADAARQLARELEESGTKGERTESAEVFHDVLRRIGSMGERGKNILRRLMDEMNARGAREGDTLRRLVNDTMNDGRLSSEAKRRRKRDLVLSSPLHRELTEEDADGEAPLEEGMLRPDGIAEDRGTVNETTMNDRSNSEFWSSFSSSEERLLECKGLILNLPLTPHRYCTREREGQHSTASIANTVTYRVPLNGYYFFVFNSENEIQPNYVRVRFDLMKNVYNTSNPVHACENSTHECSLPFKIFSNERTVFELPLSGNDSQWNEEYVVVSTCEPRKSVYTVCIVAVPVLFLFFALR